MKQILLFLLLISYACGAEVRVDPLVLISNQGLVRGHKATDGDYSIFLGIPYARVNIDNPFGLADEPSAFHEIIHNAVDAVKCPQASTSSIGEELLDCLRLNIYVPSEASSRNPLPVLVWIHGGDFISGSAGDYGVRNLVRHGVVIVTINYRLGPYGFMCLDIPAVPGNQGLKDQFQALRWIRNNIASFGGNQYNVTISGQDAGAASVLFHLYSNNEKYFHKVISESGTPQTERMFVNADVEAAIKLSEYLGFNTTNTEEAIQFLSRCSPELVVGAAVELDLGLKPCRERSFSGINNIIPDDPYLMSNKMKLKNTPILIGNTEEERHILSADYFNSDPFYDKIHNHFHLDEEHLKVAAKNVRHFYIGDKVISSEDTLDLKKFESDFDFNHPLHRTVSRLLEQNAKPIYQYIFNYVGDTEADGAVHSAELNYLFELAGVSTQKNEQDQLVIDRMTTLWTNFIKYGNPTPRRTELLPVSWQPVTSDTRPTLVIDTDLHIDNRVNHYSMAYWDLFYTMYGIYNNILQETCTITDNYYKK